MKRTCICEICTCGRHHCPHQPSALYIKGRCKYLLPQSEYTEKYPSHGFYGMAQSMKPKQGLRENKGMMDTTTTFRSDYVPYDVTYKPLPKQPPYEPKCGGMDFGTSYNITFKPHDVHPCIPSKPVQRLNFSREKLDTLPTYRDDFQPWDVGKRVLVKADSTYHPSTIKFDNTTTFQDDYVLRGLVPRESCKPPNKPLNSDVPLESLTSHRLAFVPHALEARYIHSPDKYIPPGCPFQEDTTHRIAFQGRPGQMVQSCKPCNQRMGPDIPFEGSTECRESFQKWPVRARQLPKPVEYVRPSERMAANTTTRDDFVKHNIQPVILSRPLSRSQKDRGPFLGNTTTREDFKAWETPRVEIRKKPDDVRKTDEKMESMSTFRTHYTPHQIVPQSSCKPRNPPLRCDAPFDGNTTYYDEYTSKEVNVCPASYSCPPGYVFEENDEQGHRIFHKLSRQDNKVQSEMNGIKDVVMVP